MLAPLALLLAPMLLALQDEVITACQREGHFAFTFDQGPSPHTGILLRTLAKHKVKATFHVTTTYLQNPVIMAYLRKTCNEGHLVGLYVKDDVKDDEGKLRVYLKQNAAIIKKHCNYEPQFLRFPLGAPSPSILKMVSGMGYAVTSYNLDSQDYNATSETTPQNGGGTVFMTFKGIEDQIDPPSLGAFISVQNDLVQASVQQTDAILAYTVKKGYKPVRLDECIAKQAIVEEGIKEEEPKRPIEKEANAAATTVADVALVLLALLLSL